VLIDYFFSGEAPNVDSDNLAKPILDALSGLIYLDDRQVARHQVTNRNLLGDYRVGVSFGLARALEAGREFVRIRVDEWADDGDLSR
jgi:hypothetical protein